VRLPPRRRLLLAAPELLLVALGLVVALVLVAAIVRHTRADRPLPPYQDPRYSAAERAADLVARMTTWEKASQLVTSQAPAIPRLGVPAYGWWNEAAHGVAREQTNTGANPPDLVNTTSYPVSLSLAASWDPELMFAEATAISDEAREVVRDNRLDLDFFSPTVNLSRDPRWGRNDETFGEDPVLTAAMAAKYVLGMEGKDPDGRLLPEAGRYLKTATTLKHYAANNSEADRLTGSSNVGARDLREYYTAQFRDVVRTARPASIMSAYNAVNGVPAAANSFLMDTLARQTYGFDGYFVADCDAVYELEAGHHWTPPGEDVPVDGTTRAVQAHAAGEDLECNQGYNDQLSYADVLPSALQRKLSTAAGPYTEAYLDASLVRLFSTRFALGEFDPAGSVPWVGQARARVPAGSWRNDDSNRAVTQTRSRLGLARRAAAASLVLLKNSAGLLPLRPPPSGPYRVAVLGPYDDPDGPYLGGYSSLQGEAGAANTVSSHAGLDAAIRRVNPEATVDYLPALAGGPSGRVDPDTVRAVAGYDLVVLEAITTKDTAAEDRDRTGLALPGEQAAAIHAVAAANPRTVVYLQTAGPVDVSGFEGAVPALLWSSYNGQRQGEGLADVLLGTTDPAGRLPFTWYRDDTQLPPMQDYGLRPGPGHPGRTYQFFTGTPQYPFGHGLGYGSFRYGGLRADRSTAGADDTVRLSVRVTNTGPRRASDVTQLYVATPDAPAAAGHPGQRLAGFEKVTLEPGASREVTFTVGLPGLAFWDDRAARMRVDPGRYEFRLAASSATLRSRAVVTVSGSLTPRPAVVTLKPRAGTGPDNGAAQVLFRPGDRIDPRLTLALADQTLTGYRRRGDSTPLPAGTSVQYRSNRPDVVRVEGGAAPLRAGAAGVATVTATVTGPGGRAAADFVVLVR
jgi:beta-glucosidase